MKKLLIVIFVLGFSIQGFANLDAKQVLGKWKYTVETGQGQMTGILKFVEKEGKLAGDVIPDEGGVYPFTKVELKEGNILYFELKPEYDVIKVSVKVEGDKFKGTGSTYDGDFTLTGEKQ
ncbi:MAG: hypothetical protein HN778_05975 [Prolixibacteraceae bacterium]|jgi:hypothetical protein|nr:hypothetical protein [Prolixibacteraceae bacterium]MBT6004453.1 hypothetical protein [Prolixibacteraceae bacterium]MBT6763455.1 hypothetical protein [Prolixibacteraceae bacterium]MBT6999986.1 hypothetical protein [Prolixibacteraceae bacterium]MBT7394362.1 hypothetical protein [Prolixibacteraceae bacterium]